MHHTWVLGIARGLIFGSVPSRHTLTSLFILAISIAAPIGAISHITGSAYPTIITLTKVRPNRKPMHTSRIAHSNLAIGAFPAIKAITFIRSNAPSVNAGRTYSKLTLITRPSLLTDAGIRPNADSMYAPTSLLDPPISIANSLVTVYTCPTLVALAALALHLVILLKTLPEML
jgi:hypothetical protein